MLSDTLSVQTAENALEQRAVAEDAALKLLDYCRRNGWAGYDPYDALNSKLLGMLPFLNSRIPRLVLTQALKRSPVNLRRLLLIDKTQNPKAIGLFLSALLKLQAIRPGEVGGLIQPMIDRLADLRSRGTAYWCWGYSFPWQTRVLVVPRGAPNLVCTVFAADALLEAYEQLHESKCLTMASSAAEYILNDLYWTRGSTVAGFSYPRPEYRVQVYNANFLAAALLCRVYRHTGDRRFLGPALAAARYSAAMQFSDGSWTYGEMSSQHWIDNFHTGFNLCALRSIGRYAETAEFEPYLRRGLDFYRSHFFCEGGAVRYFHNRTYPIDIHCVAQAIITLAELEDLEPSCMELARSVFQWAMRHMWDEQGFFYYRVLRYCTNRISYMRWSQAWMLLAMATLLSKSSEPASPPQHLRTAASIEV